MSASPADAVVELVLLDDELREHGRLILSALPKKPSVAPRDVSHAPDRRRGAPTTQLVEASEYRYALQLPQALTSLQPEELFDADDRTQMTGRISTGEAVGDVLVTVTLQDGTEARARVDVQPYKLGDEAAFQSMLNDLAALSVEALHQGFAPASSQLGRGGAATPRLLYQRFAVLHAQLFSRDLAWALSHLLADPHRHWASEAEPRRPGTPVRGSSRLARSLTRPGPRVSWVGPMSTLPARIDVDRTTDTVDTVPNRYVRFVLEQWRMLSLDALHAAATLQGAAARRGTAQAERAIDRIDELLGQPLFRQVGRLTSVPQGNTVLLRREGYRQVAGAASLVESSLGMQLEIDDPFLVSRRSIALLYEHWTFVRLARAVAAACGTSVTQELFEVGPHGMSLVLRSAQRHRLSFTTLQDDVPLAVDLFYNRTFGSSHSWTRPMRPDASLLVRPRGSQDRSQEHFLHFDAKYRLDIQQVLSDAPDETQRAGGHSKREDLLKMHAYRDAIRGSAAAFVMFPGNVQRQFHLADSELLPSIGALPLRPDHADEDTERLTTMVARLLRSVASDASRYGRARYWEQTAYAGPGLERTVASPGFLERPPADTPVLLGYVRSAEQWRWVQQHGLYNVRGDERPGSLEREGRELGASLLVLYGLSMPRPVLFLRKGPWRAADRDELRATGYLQPRGRAYFVAEVTRVENPPAWLTVLRPHELSPPGVTRGTPFVRSWLDLVLAAS